MDAEQKNDVEQATEQTAGPSRWQRFRSWYAARKKWTIPASVVLLLIILAAIPWTRYKATGLVLKKDFTLQVIDSETKAPVSGAFVGVGSNRALTNGNGAVTLRHLSVGSHTFLVNKKYYIDLSTRAVVPIFRQKQPPSLALVATGRQVKIVVKNLITQKTLSDVDIKVAGTTAKTDKDGEAIIVVAVGTSEQKATLSLSGYNDADVTVKVSDSQVLENDFTLTPAGQVYFLSNRTGRLDLMKVNLDGSGAQVVVAGTGYEHDYDTVLLPSPDWKYVALVTRRSVSDPAPQLYILSTADDQLLNIDSGNAYFTLDGWSGDSLIYTVSRNDLQLWEPYKYKLKGYDATSGRITLLDQTAATGRASAYAVYAYETYVLVYVANNSTIVFAKNWIAYDPYSSGVLNNDQHRLFTISPEGKDLKTVASYDARPLSVSYKVHSPTSIFISVINTENDNATSYFDYLINTPSPKSTNINQDDFYRSYPTHYASPSGKQTFWAENRDGKNTLFAGDANGNNASTIATLSELSPYGWFSDNYLLLTKNRSELYIMGAHGSNAYKITDYQPAGGI